MVKRVNETDESKIASKNLQDTDFDIHYESAEVKESDLAEQQSYLKFLEREFSKMDSQEDCIEGSLSEIETT